MYSSATATEESVPVSNSTGSIASSLISSSGPSTAHSAALPVAGSRKSTSSARVKTIAVHPFLCDYQRVWELDLAKAAYAELAQYFLATLPPSETDRYEDFARDRAGGFFCAEQTAIASAFSGNRLLLLGDSIAALMSR